MRKIPWWTPVMTGQEISGLQDVITRNFLNDGPVTTQFENALADFLGVRFAVAVSSCTTGLFCALKAMEIGPGDEVLVPDVTFMATANAVSMTGASPVLVDVIEKNLTINIEDAKSKINERTKAVIPVHVSGRGADMHRIMKWADACGLAVIEDAAEALGSVYQGKMLGSWGVMGCFSFSPMKMITTGQGGLIITNDEMVHGRLRELKDQGRPVRGTGGDDPHVSVGYNFKLTDLQSSVGMAQLDDLPRRLKRMRDMYRLYSHALHDVPQVRVLPFDVDGGEVPQWIDVIAEDRDHLATHLSQRGADTRHFWRPMHHHPPYRMDDVQYPVSSRMIPHALWLPSGLTISDRDITDVCQWIKEFYQ